LSLKLRRFGKLRDLLRNDLLCAHGQGKEKKPEPQQ
jgi:hypothetical protein